MESFRVVTTLTLEDWRALTREHAARSRSARSPARTLLEVATWAVCTIAALIIADMLDVDISAVDMVAGMVLLGCILFVTLRTARQRLHQEAADLITGECTYVFDGGGVHVVNHHADARYRWSAIRDVSLSAHHIFLWLSSQSAFVVPIRDLPAEVGFDNAVTFIRECAAADRNEFVAIQPYPTVSGSGVAIEWWKALFWWWALRATPPARVSDRAIVLASLASLFLWSALDRLRVGANAVFNSYNIPTLALFFLALLLIARVISKRSSHVDFRAGLFIVLAAVPVLIGFNFLHEMYASGVLGVFLWALTFLYGAIYLTRALRSQSGSAQPQGAVLGIATILILVVLSNEFYWSPSLWYAPESAEEPGDQPTWSAGEPLLFSQRERIDAALEQVAPHDLEVPSNFFVGFAGVAEQKVFAEEIELASRVIADRYGTSARSLLLLNDRRDVDSQPLATVSGLAYALKGIAAKMDVDRDVLFLSLSSHGSDKPQLQVTNGVLPLLQVTGENLVAALEQSGIKHRVLIISACHAGAFIGPLQNEHTIVITAAAKEKTSFGCSDDRDLTYFGEAFYRDALPKAPSLRAAFDIAKTAITAREKAEDFTPSDPQAFFGAELEAKLKR